MGARAPRSRAQLRSCGVVRRQSGRAREREQDASCDFRDRALEESLNSVTGRQRILLAEIDERLDVVVLEQDEADDVRARRLLRAESTGEVAEERRELRLEVSRQAAEVLRRTQDHDV